MATADGWPPCQKAPPGGPASIQDRHYYIFNNFLACIGHCQASALASVVVYSAWDIGGQELSDIRSINRLLIGKQQEGERTGCVYDPSVAKEASEHPEADREREGWGSCQQMGEGLPGRLCSWHFQCSKIWPSLITIHIPFHRHWG